MPSLLLEPDVLVSAEVTLGGEQAHYLLRVHRLGPGDAVWLFDGQGSRYQGRIVRATRHTVHLLRGPRETPDVESPIDVHLVQSIPKAEKMDWIVQKTTELGVASITPVVSTRSAVRSTRRVDRWNRIAASAALQSGRVRVPTVYPSLAFDEFIETRPGWGLLLWEEAHAGLKGIVAGARGAGHRACRVLIGPEGGFTENEARAAEDRGIAVASLGARILRTETAAIAAVGIVQYELGDLGGASGAPISSSGDVSGIG